MFSDTGSQNTFSSTGKDKDMSQIKTASTAPGPAAHAEQDLQLARQQAERKGSEILLQELSRTVKEQREDARDSRTDPKRETPTDTAEIARTRRSSASDGTSSADEARRWILEMAEKVWESFLEWQPDGDLDLTKQLQELSKLYLALLEATLKNAEGEALKEQMDRLDHLLAQKLDLVMEQDLEALISLLEESGQTAALDSVRSSLYRQTAGRAISPQTAHMLFAQGASMDSRSKGARAASPSFSGNGMIYGSSGKQNVRFQQTYHTQQVSWKEQLRQRKEVISNARNGIVENSFKRGSSVSCSGRELERADRFAAHMTRGGDLFQDPHISARNEEVTGLIAAVMSIKGQVYAEKSGGTSSITVALEKLVDRYLRQHGGHKVYYRTLTAYKQMKDPQKAIQSGQDYAYQQFREKQKAAGQRSGPYAKESGFFQALLKKLSPEKEYALGVRLLQEDWTRFLSSVGNRQDLSYRPGIERYSPWGLFAGPGTIRAGRDGLLGKVLLGITTVIILGALVVVCFHLM